MKQCFWTIDIDNKERMYVWAATILTAIKLAVCGYNRDYSAPRINSSNITRAQQGKLE